MSCKTCEEIRAAVKRRMLYITGQLNRRTNEKQSPSLDAREGGMVEPREDKASVNRARPHSEKKSPL